MSTVPSPHPSSRNTEKATHRTGVALRCSSSSPANKLADRERTHLRVQADLDLTSYDGLDHDLSQTSAGFPRRQQQALYPRGVSGEFLVLMPCASHSGWVDRREPAPMTRVVVSEVIKAIQETLSSNTDVSWRSRFRLSRPR